VRKTHLNLVHKKSLHFPALDSLAHAPRCMPRATGALALALALVLGGTGLLLRLPGLARAREALAVYHTDSEHRRARARLQALLTALCVLWVLARLRRSPRATRAIAALAPLGPAFVAGVERHLREPWELWP